MTLPEVLPWRLLRTRPEGLKFRKQHPIGDFIVDFYCDNAKMVVEVDGIVHSMGEQPQSDLRRDAVLKAEGYSVIRVPAAEVLHDPEANGGLNRGPVPCRTLSVSPAGCHLPRRGRIVKERRLIWTS